MEKLSFYKQKNVLVCGGNGFIGSHLVNSLVQSEANVTVIGKSLKPKNFEKSDIQYVSTNLLELNQCKKVIKDFDYVFNAAGVSGGIDFQLNNSSKLFLENSLLNLNLLLSLADSNVERYQFLSSVAVYPSNAKNPLSEVEPINFQNTKTDFGYAEAKILGELHCKSFVEEFGLKISVIRPDNTFGPNDNFLRVSPYVIPSLIKKILQSDTSIEVWGSGKQIRTFIFVKDLVQGLLLGLEKHPSPDPINISSNEKITIKSLTELIIRLCKKNLIIKFDTTKPEGSLERTLKISKAEELLGFSPKWNLSDGLAATLDWYKNYFGHV